MAVSGVNAVAIDARVRKLSYRWEGDGPPPGEGDVLVSVYGKAVYLIVDARRMDSPIFKLKLAALRIEPDSVPDDATVYDLVWDRRSSRRAA